MQVPLVVAHSAVHTRSQPPSNLREKPKYLNRRRKDKSIYAELSAYKCPSDYLGNLSEKVEIQLSYARPARPVAKTVSSIEV